MTLRIRYSDTTATTSVNRTLVRCGLSSLVTTMSGPKNGIKRYMADHSIPGYKRHSSAGVVFSNPMQSERATLSSGGSGYTRTDTGVNCGNPAHAGFTVSDSRGFSLGNGSGPAGLDQSVIPNHSAWLPLFANQNTMITLACTRALGGIKAPDIQGHVFVAELQKTLNTLRNPIKGITDYLTRAQRKGRRKPPKFAKSKSAARGAADQYLGSYYGILPMMMDVEGIIKALHRTVVDRQTSRASESSTVSLPPVLTTTDLGAIDRFVHRDSGTEVVTVRAGSLYGIRNQCFLDGFGIGLSDIPAAAWELVPYSFVVDWFFNVGEVIQALSPVSDVNRLSEWYTVKRVVTVNRVISSHTSRVASWSITTPSTDWQSCIYETYTRVPTSLGNHVGLAFKPRLNTFKVLAGISLITQLLTKGR